MVCIPVKNREISADNRKLLFLVYSVLLCIIRGDRLLVKFSVASTVDSQVLRVSLAFDTDRERLNRNVLAQLNLLKRELNPHLLGNIQLFQTVSCDLHDISTPLKSVRYEVMARHKSRSLSSIFLRLDSSSTVRLGELILVCLFPQMASGECNEDTEVYNITLSTGDELTLMGQAEILYAKTSKEKSRFNTIFKKIGKLNSISKIGRGKMPCLICMNHRTNESISLPFQCKGRFSTCSPTELQMQDGEHTIRNIVEKTRLPVNVTVPSSPPRNQHDLHLIREGHRYKLVNVQTKTVVVCCILRSSKIIPIHFPFHMAMPRFIVPEELLQGELWLDTMVHRWFSFCQEQFDIDDYSRAVRDVRTDWNEDGKSPKKCSGNGSCSGSSGGSCTSNGGPSYAQIPSSLSYARDELTQSFHRLSVCVYGSNLHGNSEVNLQGCVTFCGDWALLPSDNNPSDSGESEHFFPELLDNTSPQPSHNRADIPYEELWLDHLRGQVQKPAISEGIRGVGSCCGTSAALSYPTSCPLVAVASPDVSLTPPPVPPKSEAVSIIDQATFPTATRMVTEQFNKWRIGIVQNSPIKLTFNNRRSHRSHLLPRKGGAAVFLRQSLSLFSPVSNKAECEMR